MQQAGAPKTAAKSVTPIVMRSLITKGQIQDWYSKWDRFFEAVSLICTEVFLWLILHIFYWPENFGIGVGIAPVAPWLRVWWQPYSDCRLQTSAGICDWKFMYTPMR